MAALCEKKKKVLAIGGPTATGKTALSIALARRFGGEVVGADSMQIYRFLDVGTAKPTEEERRGVAHHLIGFLPPEESFSVADYTKMAADCIDGITARGALPIMVGGTGLYLTSLLDGVRFAPQKTDPALRQALMRRAEAGEGAALYAELCRADPEAAAQIHPNNLTRVVRALELYHAAGITMSQQKKSSRPAEKPYDALCFCLTFRDRAALYARIDARVDKMLAAGLLEEARLVYENREAYRTAAQAIGYKEYFPYFTGEASLDACTAALKQASRRYAKRQLTWFRNQADAVWLYADEPDVTEKATRFTEAFLAGEGSAAF